VLAARSCLNGLWYPRRFRANTKRPAYVIFLPTGTHREVRESFVTQVLIRSRTNAKSVRF